MHQQLAAYAKRKRRARTARLVQPILNSLQLRLELLVLQRKTAVSVLKQSLKILYPLVPRQKLALCDTSLLLERGVLVNELLLYKCKLFEVTLEERHLLLLSLAVAVADDVVVLLLDFIELDLEFNHLHA